MNAPIEPAPVAATDVETVRMAFDDNGLLIQLFGSHHSNLARIEQYLNVTIHAQGNEVAIVGSADAAGAARGVLQHFIRPP